MKIVVSTLLLALLMPLSSFAEDDASNTTPARKVWILKTLDGQSINLAEQIAKPENKIMVFWATWCPYCKQLMPIVNDLKHDYPELEVLSFNVFDDLEPKNYATKANWPFTHVLDGDEFARVHGVKGLPTLFLVNGDGKMVLDLREIDTSAVQASGKQSNRDKAFVSAPLWNAGLRKALDQMQWSDTSKIKNP